MYRIFTISLVLFLATLFNPKPVLAAETGQEDAETLCFPGVYINIATDCSQTGPSQYLTEAAEQGIIFPVPPIPAHHPDFDLTYVDYLYGQVHTNNAPVYASIEDALKAKKKNAVRRIESPFSYISYTDQTMVDGKRLYMVDPGSWMTAHDVIRVSIPTFQGISFHETPARTFGWVLAYLSPYTYVETKRTPNYQNDDYTGHIINNHEVIWVYGETKVGDEDWYQVGPDEWLPGKLIARVIPNPTPPEGSVGSRWIEVNLFEQTLAVYDDNQLVFATLIASGLDPFWTQPGLFQIYEKLATTPMSGSFEADRSDAYYLEDVPWTMYFDEARALHGAYWRANLGFPQSHGCINLSIGDSRWLFDWAEVGDWVYVWDPSGETPTDPSYYGKGGA